MDFNALLQSKRFIKGAVAAVIVAVLAIWFFVGLNSATNTMATKESTLNAKYLDNQNVLSKFTRTVKEALGVSVTVQNANTVALDKVLTDAVQGRYQNKDGSFNGNGKGGTMFSAITEAYPDLSGVTIDYKAIQDLVTAGELEFQNAQTGLLDKLRDYDTWKNGGFPRKLFVSMAGAPSDNLTARVGNTILHGRDAEDKMWSIVTSSEAQNAYTTGTFDGIDTGVGGAASPSAAQ